MIVRESERMRVRERESVRERQRKKKREKRNNEGQKEIIKKTFPQRNPPFLVFFGPHRIRI